MIIKKNKIINFILIFLFIYFIFHTIYGNRGIIAYYQLKKEIDNLSYQADKLSFDRIILEKQAKDLSSKNIDKDLLEQNAKKLLMFSEQDEEIIIRKIK
jgi:cell division protein FtsB